MDQVNDMVSKEPYEEAYDLRNLKDQDYNSGSVTIDDYYPFGIESYLHMILTKATRLKSLGTSKRDPNYESMRDNLLDLMNYCAIMIDRLDKGDL